MDSIQSFYFPGKNELTDEQFDRRRDDLTWEGSALVTLNRNEDDKEFDTLKESLKEMVRRVCDMIWCDVRYDMV